MLDAQGIVAVAFIWTSDLHVVDDVGQDGLVGAGGRVSANSLCLIVLDEELGVDR